jgi:hypothetical protein
MPRLTILLNGQPYMTALDPAFTEAERVALEAHLLALLAAGGDPAPTIARAIAAEQARLRAAVAAQYNLEESE